MKLRNKKTGKIVDRVDITIREEGVVFNNDEAYHSIAELNKEWEDYEEPKGHWYLNYMGDVLHTEFESINPEKKIGNYFSSREEAEKAVEKLKAWKRLKDKGFRSFSSESCGDDFVVTFKLTNHVDYDQSIDDFECVFDFGGEE